MSTETLMMKDQLGAFRLSNGWFPDHFLHVENRLLEVSPIENNWKSAVWNIVQVERQPFVRIVNQWLTTCCIQLIPGQLIFGHAESHDLCSHWYLEPIKASQNYRIRHRSTGDQYLHFEDRVLQLGPIDHAWWSAQWNLQRS
jgi:hypothetical protein